MDGPQYHWFISLIPSRPSQVSFEFRISNLSPLPQPDSPGAVNITRALLPLLVLSVSLQLTSCPSVKRLGKSALSMPGRLLKMGKRTLSDAGSPVSSDQAIAARAQQVQAKGEFTGQAQQAATADSSVLTAAR